MNSVIKGASYVLAHTPQMVVYNGTTQTTERIVNPESEYLKELESHLRSYEECVNYWPNQVYIGNATPEDLAGVEFPYYDKVKEGAERYGKYGEIMPEEEFILLVQACDQFEVVKIDKEFVSAHKDAFAADPIITEDIVARVEEGVELSEIEAAVKDEHAEGIYVAGKLVACVKRAHDIDVNLSAHVMHENLMSKASSVLALLYGVKNAGISKDDIEYVIDCAEEACGDMNQRGGGNFAKAAAEIAGLNNATGSDSRGFCAGPSHALIEAAALVKSGAYKCVAVTAGGCTAKLGMNGKDHVKKGLPILEDCLAGFCVMGGIFSEGIDLTRDRLIGAVIVGTGLPQVCNDREILRSYFDSRKLSGLDYAYLYPGMNKVLQSAGRVIRTEEDRGVMLLLDERFLGAQYQGTFPREWSGIQTCRLGDLKEKLNHFWGNGRI